MMISPLRVAVAVSRYARGARSSGIQPMRAPYTSAFAEVVGGLGKRSGWNRAAMRRRPVIRRGPWRWKKAVLMAYTRFAFTALNVFHRGRLVRSGNSLAVRVIENEQGIARITSGLYRRTSSHVIREESSPALPSPS